jgi:hypothetical protein
MVTTIRVNPVKSAPRPRIASPLVSLRKPRNETLSAPSLRTRYAAPDPTFLSIPANTALIHEAPRAR